MPIYTFRNKDTGEEYELAMMVSERKAHLEENPHVEQIITTANQVVHERGTNLRVPDSFREVTSKIKDTYKINNIKDY